MKPKSNYEQLFKKKRFYGCNSITRQFFLKHRETPVNIEKWSTLTIGTTILTQYIQIPYKNIPYLTGLEHYFEHLLCEHRRTRKTCKTKSSSLQI